MGSLLTARRSFAFIRSAPPGTLLQASSLISSSLSSPKFKSTLSVRKMSSAPFPYNPYDCLPPAPTFQVTSTDITDGGVMPGPQCSKAFGVEGGEDVSPNLTWSGFPPETKSFVVSCYDPDAPTCSGFWHQVIYDIPASVTSLPTGAGTAGSNLLPAGAKLLKNDAGFPGYVGAAPPPGHGSHRYIFCVSALPVETLPIDENTTPAVCHFNMFGIGVLGRAFLTATFGR